LFTDNLNGWRTNYYVTNFMKDPLMRASLNQFGPGAHITEEGLYFSTPNDSGGVQLNGANRYEITFPAGQLPPADAFWSLTMQDSKTMYLIDNPINRFAINNFTPVEKGADGSLKIVLQHTQPQSAVDQANWLPAPSGDFWVMIRAYQPKQELLDHKYKFPSVLKA
jgi:hypothetical protein